MSSELSSASVSEEEKEGTNFAAIEDPYRQAICEAIHEGLSELKWGWRQSIHVALRKDFDQVGGSSLSSAFVRSIIAESEAMGVWPVGWAEAQMAEARLVQRLLSPPSRYAFVARGHQVGNAALTDQKVRAIRKQYAARYEWLEKETKVTIKRLATKYNVDPMTIRRVLRRETWAHVK